MKKFIPLFLVSAMAVSCLSNNTGYEATYPLYVTFDGLQNYYTGTAADTSVAMPAFAYGPVAFYGTLEDDQTVLSPDAAEVGSWVISRSHYPIEVLLKHIAAASEAGDGTDTGDGTDGTGTGEGTGDGSEGTASVVGLPTRAVVDWESKLTPFCVADTTDSRPNQGTDIFLVYHQNDKVTMPEHDIAFLQSNIGTCTLYSCFLNNTAAVAKYFSLDAAAGDYFVVNITGTLNDSSTGRVSFTLADRRNGANTLVKDWTRVDLTSLGSVQFIDFEIDAVMSNAAADEDLMFFCFDNFTSQIHIQQ